MRQLIVDYLPFEIQPSQINESMKENDGKLIVSGILQRANAENTQNKGAAAMRQGEKAAPPEQQQTRATRGARESKAGGAQQAKRRGDGEQ